MLKGEFSVLFTSIDPSNLFASPLCLISFERDVFCVFFLHRVQIHRLILAAMSNFFATLLRMKTVDDQEIILVDLDGVLIKQIVSFAYTGEIEINEENVIIYATVALDLELDLLQNECEKFFNENLSIRNCIEWFMFASDSDTFRELRQKAFRLMIAADENSFTEEAIFNRLVEWVEFDTSARSKYTLDLLKCIRLENIQTEVGNRK